MPVLDALLDQPLAESTTSRERWAAWEAKHLNPIHALKAGESHSGPGGITVTRQKPDSRRSAAHTRFTVEGGGTMQVGKDTADKVRVSTADKAAMVARVRSARSTHPDSLGGPTKIDHPGKPASPGEAASPVPDGRTFKGSTSVHGGKLTHYGLRGKMGASEYHFEHKGKRHVGKTRSAALAGAGIREAALDALLPPLAEAADSMAKASTPEPTGKGPLWKTPGLHLPYYIQHVYNDLKPSPNRYRLAVGIVQNWAAGHDGKGNKVSATTQAAAAKAIAEWEADKGKAKAHTAGKALQHSDLSVVDQLALADAAEARLLAMAQAIGVSGLWSLLGEGGPGGNGELVEADASAPAWKPELKRTASAPRELERHDVHDNGQHVGTIAKDPSYSPREPARFTAQAVNGERIGERTTSQQAALDALKRHLEEAPARVTRHRGGKFLVARPATYSGQTTYTEYPGEGAARHAAGLPPTPSTPERASQVVALGESVAADLALVESFAPKRYGALWGPMLRGRAEGGRSVPLARSEALAEAFNTALHPHGFHGLFTRTSTAASHLIGRAGTSPRLPVRQPDSRTHTRGRFHGRKLSEPELVAAAKHGVWTQSAERAHADISRGLVADTEHAHRAKLPNGKLGHYSAERTALHATIIRSLLQGTGSTSKPKAIFMAGGPASGKTALLKKGSVKPPKDHVAINPDLVKELLPEYRSLRDAGHPHASSAAHEESSHIAKLATNIALGQKMHVVIDTVGNSDPGKFARKLKAAQAAGHSVHVHYASVPTDTAAARNKARARTVPEGYLRAAHRSVVEHFHHEVRHLSGVAVHVHDTTGRRPRLVATKARNGGVHVNDRKRYAAFMAKGGFSAGG